MRVKSIVIDGFKSYAHRKELADLSSHFNAITGLNGSGKSNIFDAICFVMGITNLKRVRAEDPRELIFRAGTTGVHAARVTIEFINDDPASAPPGYSCEEHPIITIGRQIKLGGRQQFFFNSTVSLQSKVKRFFESISLNVDNPHFMILQGTVHKLIGMRSQDILSLIEEAVGTKAFDHRRRTAETLIRNKEKKMEEIDSNVEHQIRPMLDAMKADQEEYSKFMRMCEGMEEKQRFRIAFEYHNNKNELDGKETATATRRQDVNDAKAQMQNLPRQEEDLTRRVMQLQEGLGAPSEKAIALREEEDELKKLKTRYEGQMDACGKVLKQLEAQLKALRKEEERQQKGNSIFAARRQEHDALLERIKSEKETVQNLKQALKLLQSGVQAGSSGVSIDEERRRVDLSLIEQGSTVKRATERIAELEKQRQRAEKARHQQAGELQALEGHLQQAMAAYATAEKQYRPLATSHQRKEALEGEISALKREYQAEYENLQSDANNARSFDLDFNRRACPPGTEDHILGRVGELIVPTDAKHSMGLMVGAQSQLLRVVVTDDRVAESIIKSGLRQRTSFIALNKMEKKRSPLDDKKMSEAQRIATQHGGWVHVARSLVTVKDPSVAQLADTVFGSFLVCSSLPLAQELAYHASVRVKAVTTDGEVAEPNGLITGGSSKQLRDIFGELQAHAARRAPLKQLQQRMHDMESEYRNLREKLHQHQGVITAFKNAEEAVELARQKHAIASSSAEGGIVELEEAMTREKDALNAAQQAVVELQAQQKKLAQEASSTNLETSRKQMEKQLAEAEKHLTTLVAAEERGAAEFERLEADTEQQAADLERKKQEAEEELAQQQSEKLRIVTDLDNIKQQITDVQLRSKQNEEHRQRVEKDIEEAQEELSRVAERKVTLDNLIKNGEAELRDSNKVVEELRRHVREAEHRNAWLLEVVEELNQPNSRFYFDDRKRTATILQELREAEAQAAVMSKKMTQKSAILYEDRRREYEELVKQRNALGEDKEAIQRCIQGIEAKKWSALDRMVGVVSSIYGKLFSTCLPGATAELVEERDEHQHLCGLGVRVLFNGKPKESLSELSGGQRSLLALCLILAILRVRPAPLYILDEVDAALDPSHTQNIGRMLQMYFPKSQFLLVSLKDGMFNNANVLYQVHNTQGYSEITRTEHRPKSDSDHGATVTVPSGNSEAKRPRTSASSNSVATAL